MHSSSSRLRRSATPLLVAVVGAALWSCSAGSTPGLQLDAGVDAQGDESGSADAADGSSGGIADADDGSALLTDFDRLRALSGKRVYFQHASVGGEAMGVYQGISAWPDPTWGIVKIVADNPGSGTSVATDAYTAAAIPAGSIGEWSHGADNGQPATKLSLFDQHVRGGLGGAMDIAMLKLGTPDIDQGTGTMAGTNGLSQATWFATVYQPTMAALEAAYPKTTFIHATIPIHNCVAYWGNAYYEQWNERIRSSYPGRVFDLAYWESVNVAAARAYGPDGAPCIHADWAIPGDAHVNEAGANWLGEHLLAFLASLP